MKNFDKGMAAFDKGMADFNKSMDQFGEGIGGKKDSKSKMEKIWGKSDKSHDFILGNKKKSNPNNMDKIWGTSKKKSSSVKIWSDKPVQRKRKTKRKSKSDEWDNREAIWGKSKKFKL